MTQPRTSKDAKKTAEITATQEHTIDEKTQLRDRLTSIPKRTIRSATRPFKYVSLATALSVVAGLVTVAYWML